MSNQEQSNQEQILYEAWSPGDVLFYGPSARSITCYGDINRQSSLVLTSQILELETRGTTPITLYLNTDGGVLADALAIYDTLRSIKSPIITITTGVCASAGLLLLSAGDIRLTYPNTIFFYHQPIFPGQEVHSSEQIKSTADMYELAKQKYDGIIQRRCNMSPQLWTNEFVDRTTKYFTAQQAKSYNMIDGIIPHAEKTTKLEWVYDGQ